MSKKLKLSPWHDGNIAPMYIGVYEVDSDDDGTQYYSFFNGDKWRGHWNDIEKAFEMNKKFTGVSSETLKWRGILK